METFHAEHVQVFSVFMDDCSVFISYTWVRHLHQVKKYQMTTSVIMYALGRGRQT